MISASDSGDKGAAGGMMGSWKYFVEVCSAHNLMMPKDGHGAANPYCILDFASQRRKTTVKHNDLNPVWNETHEFVASDPSQILAAMAVLEIQMYSEKQQMMIGGRDSFLGKVLIPGSSFVKPSEAAIVPYALEKRNLFSHVKGDLRLRLWYADAATVQSAKQNVEKKQQIAIAAPSDIHYSRHLSRSNATDHDHHEKEFSFSDSSVATVLPASEFDLKDTAPELGTINGEKVASYDLVEKMQYLFVRVVRARGLAAKDVSGGSDPYVTMKINQGKPARTRAILRTVNPEWNQAFAFSKEKIQGPILEITVWNEVDMIASKEDFLGGIAFELTEIPSRVPPDSPLAPTWYKLEESNSKRGGYSSSSSVKGEIMLSVWWGSQADEAFGEAWQSDTGGLAHTRSKVYHSPKLWYLRLNVIEAQDLMLSDKSRFPDVCVRAQLGIQMQKTKVVSSRNTSPLWNEELLFVAAEPFEEPLQLSVEDRMGAARSDQELRLGTVRIALNAVERRVDYRPVNSSWYNLEKNGDKPFRGRIHLRICLDGGYHVMDESTNYISDVRPTARQLRKPSLGIMELGILSGKGFLPMKTREGRGTADAYCVAKYGEKWVRTRTIVDSFKPKWNEQYTWEVYDPCTVLTVGVFDNQNLNDNNINTTDQKLVGAGGAKDLRIGKVRIRLSTLESNRVYTNSYPLVVLQSSGVKKMGELELALRFSCTSLLNVMQVYFKPPLPKMHYLHPLAVTQIENLRSAAIKIVSMRLTRSEPPLRQETVQYMLDTNSNMFSMRRSKVNYFRVLGVISGPIAVAKWFNDVCHWKTPLTTVLVHILFIILVLFPQLILPTFFLYLFLIGAWHYRFRPRLPPSMDARLSQAEQVEPDELDEEFDFSIPTSKGPEIVRARYERLRLVASRIQTVAGDLASQMERLNALLSWRDPRATAIFILFCLIAAIVLYVTPLKVVAVFLGLYVLRHPRFRSRLPAIPLNFFRRLPSLADRIL